MHEVKGFLVVDSLLNEERMNKNLRERTFPAQACFPTRNWKFSENGEHLLWAVRSNIDQLEKKGSNIDKISILIKDVGAGRSAIPTLFSKVVIS